MKGAVPLEPVAHSIEPFAPRDERVRVKVGVLVTGTAWGGSDIHSVAFVRTLSQRGYDAALFCLTAASYECFREHAPADVRVVPLIAPKPLSGMRFSDWRRLFARQPWSVCVLVKGDLHTGGGSAIDLAARACFARYLVIEHSSVDRLPRRSTKRHLGIVPGLGLWWYRLWWNAYLRSIGPLGIICVTDENRRRLREHYRFPARKLVTVRNGVDPQLFRPDRASGAAWRQRWNIPQTSLVFGAVGRLAPLKNYSLAIAAFEQVVTALPTLDARLLLIGEGPEETLLRVRAEQSGAHEQIIFAPFCDRPWEALTAIDIFLMPSISEGLPLALAEAMACSCCSIGTAVGGIPELLSSPETGWLVSPASLQTFSRAMIEAASMPDVERNAIGRRARAHIESHFDARVQLNALVDVVVGRSAFSSA